MRKARWMHSVIVAMAVLFLTACGGGGGDQVVDNTPPVTTGTIEGVAAVGAPMVNATVTIKDSAGEVVTTTTDNNGWFSTMLTNAQPPLLIKVQDDSNIVYTVVLADGTTKSVSVTPLSSMVLANTMGKTPDAAWNGFSQADANTINTNYHSALWNVYTALTPLATALGVDVPESGDLMAAFTPDHTGIDYVLDAISVTVDASAIIIKDKLGNVIVTDSVTSIDVPTATVPANIAETANMAQSIGNYFATLTQYCGNLSMDLSGCVYGAEGFVHSRSDNTFPNFLRWYYIDANTPVQVEYMSPSIKFVDDVGTWVEFLEVVSTPIGTETHKDSGYFVKQNGQWLFYGDRRSVHIDRTWTDATARIDWKVRTNSINPDLLSLGYVRVTSPAFDGEIRLYKNPARWPDQFGNYVMENCTIINNVATTGNTTCTSGYGYDGATYPKTYLLPVTYQLVDVNGNNINNWGNTAWVRY